MDNIVLKAENISKQYRLGQLGTGSLSHDLNRFWAKVRGKDDPYLRIGDVNDRSVAKGSEYVWSLKDINFEVKQGEVLGIIGKNGAGKSTLLKILSQVTTPTNGQVKVKGRIAALLEVGTGFHPDLSGRENIFLNGAILGMTKIEIKKKLEEIVEFSGVAKYIDTPVKRYSSGMTVRLGFSIAAHLEPEILIVDEVLAVGDAEFQEKCLGKMKDVSQQGRTVLFVSHNMGAIKNLCSSGIYLKSGMIAKQGNVPYILSEYYSENEKAALGDDLEARKDRKGDGSILAKVVEMINSNGISVKKTNAGESLTFRIKTKCLGVISPPSFYAALIFRDAYGDRITTISTDYYKIKALTKAENQIDFHLQKCLFSTGTYEISVIIWDDAHLIDDLETAFSFKVVENDFYGTGVVQGQNIDKVFADYQCYVD